MWIDYDADAEQLLVNTTRGRRKERNVRENPKVGVGTLNPEDPYWYVSVRGRVIELTEDGAVEHIDALTRRYMDREVYPHHGEEQDPRVIIRISTDRMATS